MVLLILISIQDGESCNGLVECIAFTQVTADHGRIACSCVGKRQRPSTPTGIDVHFGSLKGFYSWRNLHVPKLAHKVLPGRQTAGSPTQKDITIRLHQAVSIYNTNAIVRSKALSGKLFKY